MAATLLYSNGFDVNKVMTALYGRIGWRSGSLDSPSGRNFEDFHALVTEKNLADTQEAGNSYDAKEQLERAAILRVMNNVFREREFYDNTLLYAREQEDGEPIQNSSLFTGFEIVTAVDQRKTTQINSVILNFSENVSFTIYLFQDGKKTPIKTQSVSAIAGEATEVALTEFYLNKKAFRYYLGYFQSDLGTAKALAEECHFLPTKAFKAIPMYSNASGTDFNRENISYPSQAYGFNAQLSSFRDHTTDIVSRPALFDEAVGLQLAFSMIQQILYSTRSNVTERITKTEMGSIGLQVELNGYAPVSDFKQVEGISQRLKKEIERLNKQFFPKPKAQTINLC
ncbi:adaptor protein [Pseudanabaena phage Pan5]|nr:adaptor protein [Pseudanabaena phage Pan5]